MAITILFYSTILSYFSDDVDFPALEAYLSVRGGEQRIIPAHTNVGAGEEFRPALPHYDRTGFNDLPAVPFDASVLRITVSAVP